MKDDDAPIATPPRANAALLGHEAAERLILRVFGTGRMPHAWLITGPRGVGKATLAFRLARWVLAGGGTRGGGDTLALDAAHPVFRMVASAGHPDMRILVREPNEKTGKMRTEITVAQARKTIDFMHKTAGLGGWRIVLIDSVDELSTEAANALLKAIEEPPPRALFLLVNHSISATLPTIRSRCRHIILQPLEEDLVRAVLARERPDLAAEDAAALARLAEGSPGRALSLAAAGGLDLLREVEALLARLPDLDAAALEKLIDKMGRGGQDLVLVLRDLLLWWLGERVRTRARQMGQGGDGREVGRGLDRWAALWENTARQFERADARSLDRKQALLEIFYDIQATARAA